MFTHHVTMPLKADSSTGLSNKIDKSIMPFLQSEKGFLYGVTLVEPEWTKATSDTNWETMADAESYQRTGYLKVLEMLSEFVTAVPADSIFEVSSSSYYQIGMSHPLNSIS